jgi:hypothetical protein
MRPVIRGLLPARLNARGGEQRIWIPDKNKKTGESDYTYWRPHLVGRLGEYCSYCEIPLGVNLAVEHKQPKADSKVDAGDWDNLLLACTNCNSRKSSKGATDRKSDKGADKDSIESWAMFPDNKNYRRSYLKYSKQKRSKAQLRAAGLLAEKPLADDKEEFERVWVEPNGTSLYADRLKEMIKVVGLNAFRVDEVDPKASDRRVRNRTIAWDRATDLAAVLKKTDTLWRPIILAQIRETAVATGFWSVWVTVFDPTKSGATKEELEALFGAASFPGTNHKFTGGK